MNKFKLEFKAFVNKKKEKIVFFFNKRGYTFFLEKKEVIQLSIEKIIETKFYINNAFQRKQADIFIQLPICKARTLSGENFFDIERQHSVLALEYVLRNGGERNVEKELFEYYRKFTIPRNKGIQNLSEIFGVKLKKLINTPPWLVFYPWENDCFNKLDDIIKRRDLSTYVENKKRGMGINASDGGSQYIFTSDIRAKLEAKLIAKLYKSISQNGFDKEENSKDPIGAILFIDGKDYAWMISGGIHRICVLSALTQENIHVLLKGVYYRKDIKYWSNVQNNLFSVEEAEQLFDRILTCNDVKN